MIVHLGSLVCIGLIGAVFRLLTRGMPGRAAQVSRLAVTPFVLFYGAGEAILGVATGVLVQYADELPAAEQPAAAAAVQALWSNVIAADVIIGLGAVAWAVAVIAAGVAHRLAGAPLGVAILLGASAMAVVQTPPFGPVGLACLTAGIAWLGWRQHASEAREGTTSRVKIARRQRPPCCAGGCQDRGTQFHRRASEPGTPVSESGHKQRGSPRFW